LILASAGSRFTASLRALGVEGCPSVAAMEGVMRRFTTLRVWLPAIAALGLCLAVAGLASDSLAAIGVVSSGGTAVREAPATYVPGVPLTVTVTVTPNGDVQAWALEEMVPAGWRVTAVSANGHWDEKASVVRWGPFFEEVAQTLRYTLTPPAGAFETQTLRGTASFDGTDVAVTGAKTLQRAPIVRPGDGR
jgi:hypothetical protein